MNHDQVLEQFDSWLKDDSPVAAMVVHQWLVPVEGKGAVIFPPTYPIEGEKAGYNIDRFEDGSSVCQIDSVGSQANHMEPLFKRARYSKLVPQVIIHAGENEVNLLDAGHRAADAIVRFSNLAAELEKAFRALQNQGNAEPLARVAPTTLVFGVWDSRGTQAKVPRIVRSVVRAFQVDVLHRSAQYIPPVDYVSVGLLDATTDRRQQDSMSEQGLSHAPAAWTHGGVRVREAGEIRRDASLNLVAIRALGVASQAGDGTLKLRRYILGLSLTALTAPQETFLREGCQLVPDTDRAAEWRLVHHDGRWESFVISHEEALAYTEAAAQAFGVGQDRTADFKSDVARRELAKSKDERRASRRRDRSTPERGDS
jgi:CRISPR-associated protein Csb1